ncbi:hypothetical protein Tco_1248923 [Tanacetum coccineum]
MPVLKPCNSEDDIVKVVDGNATTAFWERCCTKLGAIRLGSRIAGDLAFSVTITLTIHLEFVKIPRTSLTFLNYKWNVKRKQQNKQKRSESAWSCSDTIAKLNELKRAQLHVVITNEMLASEVNAQKQHLATEMETLQLSVAQASMKRKLAILKKQEGEASAAAAVAYEEMQMEKLILEFKRLKQEAAETSKVVMQQSYKGVFGIVFWKMLSDYYAEFLINRACAVDMLHGEISDKCRDVTQLKEELDQAISLNGILSSRQTLSILHLGLKVLGQTSVNHIKKCEAEKNKLMASRGIKNVKRKTTALEPSYVLLKFAEITEVGQGKSTECSEDTYAEGLALRSTMKKETGQKSKRKRKQVMKCSGWSPAPRRFAFARDPRGPVTKEDSNLHDQHDDRFQSQNTTFGLAKGLCFLRDWYSVCENVSCVVELETYIRGQVAA